MGPSSPVKGTQPAPLLGLYLLLPNSCMDQDATEIGLGPGDIVLDWDPAPPMVRGTAAPTTFRAMSIVARHPITQTNKLKSLTNKLQPELHIL